MTIRRCRPLLGTFVEITVRPASGRATAAIDQAFEAIERVVRLMSFHDQASELSRINAAPAGAELALDEWTFELLTLAQELHRATGGSFDCGVGARLRRWGLLPSHAGASVAASDRGEGSVADVELLAGRRIRLQRAVCLDFGGIAKGFAVDQAATALQDAGVASAIVNAGGDLRVIGDSPQPIHVRDPADPQRLRLLGELADGALATSAPYFSLAARSGAPRCALADPSSGRSITRRASYSVLAPSCAVADGLTKALAVDGTLSADCRARFRAEALLL